MMKRASGWRSISAVPASTLPQNRTLTGKSCLNGRAQDAVEARIVRRALRLFGHDDADADRARRLLPLGDNIGDRRIVGVDRLDQRELVGVGPLHLDRIAAVVLVHRKWRDVDRAVDANLVHRRHHLVAGDVRGPVRHAVPGSLRRVRRIGMDLGIDDRRGKPWRSLLRFGMRSAQQRRPSGSQRRPDLQHGTPVDKPALPLIGWPFLPPYRFCTRTRLSMEIADLLWPRSRKSFLVRRR